MTDYSLNGEFPGGGRLLLEVERAHRKMDGVVSFARVAKVSGSAAGAGVATSKSVVAEMRSLTLRTNLGNAFTLSGVRFKQGGRDHIVKGSGEVQVNPSPTTGNGTRVGTLTPALGTLTLDAWATGSPQITEFRGVAAAPVNGPNSPFGTYAVVFRTAVAPIKPSSITVLGSMRDGTTFNVRPDANGVIDTPRVKGRTNYQTGVTTLIGVTPTAGAGQTATDLSFLEIPGLTTAFVDLIAQESVRYNAVAYSYLPLNADLLGIDPVRLPSDGRVPIFRPGELAVVSHVASTSPQAVSAGSVINVGRERLSRLQVLGSDGKTIATGYTENLEAGTVTFSNVTGYSQPVHVDHRIEDMGLVRDAQIDGTVTFTRPLTHAFPVGSCISSCLRAGDLKARVSLVFDQAAWNGTSYLDAVEGDPAQATYNAAAYPITVQNAGAFTERWVLKFKTSTTFDLIGEHVGVVASGTTLADFAPVNPQTGVPYMRIPFLGFGGGWTQGNILRVNTVGSMYPIWMVRTTQQGPESAADYRFLTVVRGDVDNPVT